MTRIEVVQAAHPKAGYSTPGIARGKAFESKNVLVSQTIVSRKAVSGWHHHGMRHLYGYVVSGRIKLEYGSRRTDSVVAGRGDFFHVPPGLVHRDINLDGGKQVVVLGVLIGKGKPVINVPGP